VIYGCLSLSLLLCYSVLEIHEPHLSMLQKTMKKLGLDAKSILKSSHPNTCVTLTIQRTLSLSLASRVTSKCTINGHTVTLKVLNVVTAPLLAIVDAPSAASALAKPIARLSMLDTAVPPVVLVWVSQLQSKYQTCKKKRQSLEKELASRTLPVSINEDDQQDLELLQHWVEELDGFERRVTKFCDSVAASSTADRLDSGSSLATCIDSLETLSWMDQEDDISALYQRLTDLADALKALDEQIDAASNAYQVLASLSNANSAVSAMERTRKHLMDATTQDEIGVRAQRAAEESHDLLNQVEDALQRCARFFQDDDKGLLGALEAERRACFLSVEDILGMLTEWNTLARKHGMSPYLLPSCHASLRQEMDGNVEARILLPKAMAAEKEALNELTQACEALSQARRQVANRLSTSITKRLPLLGMESSTFEAKIDAIHQPGGSSIGVDGVDFMIYHNRNNKVNGQDPQPQSSSSSSSRGGKIDVVASSGEKARILLAIECEIPGSVRALCGTAFSKSDGQEEEEIASVPPIAVIYDEIDAHVGGRAAVSLANMLSDQSRSCQVVSITHSPSVAAAADLHIVIQKDSHKDNFGSATRTAASLVEGSSRRKELARMAAGDLVTEEAEVFAEALMRIGAATSRRSPMEP
jgi:DNA repair ATPase RecN